jgi:hypothetical protein
MLLMPLLQLKYKWFEEEPLKGAIVKFEPVQFLPSRWFNASYQEEFEQWFNQEFGFRNFLVRLNNQIYFSLFKKIKARDVIVGKKNYLFERKYIEAATRSDFIGMDTVQPKFNVIKALQDTLSSYGIDLILVFAPGKGTFFNEYIPDKYTKTIQSQSNLELFINAAQERQISCLDFNSWFNQAKDTTKYPLFPQYGIHWSDYGSLLAADSLFTFIESKRKVILPKIEIKSVSMNAKLSESDYDIANGLNLLCRLKSFEMAYPDYVIKSEQFYNQLNVITVADSYYWQIFGSQLADRVLGNNKFWYYNKEVHSYKEGKIVPVGSLDLSDEVKKQDVIVVLATDANLPDFGWGFFENVLGAFASKNETKSEELIQDSQNPVILQKAVFSDLIFKEMDKMYTKAVLVCLSILASCTSPDVGVNSHVYPQNFDNLKMWTRDAAVTDEQAHSGKYAAFTDENREFSQTFEMNFDYAIAKGYSGASISVWCMMSDFDCKAAFVTSIESPDGNHPVYLSPPLTDFLKKPMSWGQYRTYLKFPALVPPGCKIKVYLWSSKKQKAWMDDVTIEFEK